MQQVPDEVTVGETGVPDRPRRQLPARERFDGEGPDKPAQQADQHPAGRRGGEPTGTRSESETQHRADRHHEAEEQRPHGQRTSTGLGEHALLGQQNADRQPGDEPGHDTPRCRPEPARSHPRMVRNGPNRAHGAPSTRSIRRR